MAIYQDTDVEENQADVEQTADAILTFAAERARVAWEKTQQPYLLALLSPDLAKEGVNYKDVIGEQRLKDFIRSAPDRIKIVTHPTQKAKIGLIPADKDFEYAATLLPIDTGTSSASPTGDKLGGSRRRYIVSNFLQLLAELDDDQIAQVQVPTHILAKLMRER